MGFLNFLFITELTSYTETNIDQTVKNKNKFFELNVSLNIVMFFSVVIMIQSVLIMILSVLIMILIVSDNEEG